MTWEVGTLSGAAPTAEVLVRKSWRGPAALLLLQDTQPCAAPGDVSGAFHHCFEKSFGQKRWKGGGRRVVFWLDEKGLALNLLLKLEAGSFHYK